MLRRLMTLTALVLTAGWLAGCASPQYLQPSPERTITVPSIGQGQAVSVTAVDGRQSEQIGTRSGNAMSTSVISVPAGTLIPGLQDEAERALRDMGFQPTTQAADGRPGLTLTLQRLDYGRQDSRPMLDKAQLESVLEVTARRGGETYSGTYTSSLSQEFALSPGLKKNQAMVERVLSDGLNRIFRDQALGRFLAR
ncbi:YajG family lipoprotein [Halomonas sp. 18H]|uniref:YajG family lipoprotein n=1 Tax=Halomonas almeriensis TaxID=308163 RepID=UPI0022317787|nr:MULTISPECIES: YajG family lipoprotein [Halomonas]MCW4149362.1 YajG family lipoprotein [Halomonas sp. 18H]MDN3553692.1 YajG family lipoprotein [Halomonas almeriensis]